MSRRQPAFVTAIAAFLGAGAAFAQAQGWTMPPATNLQVLDKKIPPRDLLNAMKSFTSALGLRCQGCHVYKGADPDDLAAFDFASDEKEAKVTTRAMMRMVGAINSDLLKGVGAAALPGEAKVTCYTCHRGERRPLTAKPQPATAGSTERSTARPTT